MTLKDQILHQHSEEELRRIWKTSPLENISIMTWSADTDKVAEYFPKDEDDLVKKYAEGVKKYNKKQEQYAQEK